LLFSCNANTDISIKTYETDSYFTVKNIVNALESSEVHLIPQGEKNYDMADLNKIRPKQYEILDASLFVYEFDNSETLIDGLEEVQYIFSKKTKYNIYVLNNVLVIYLWLPEITPDYLVDETNEKIEKGLQELVNSGVK